MRGGPPRMSMKLDNRPKALLVKGAPSSDPEIVQAVRSWFEVSIAFRLFDNQTNFLCQAGGQLASLDVHEDDSLVARFQSRAAAEQVRIFHKDCESTFLIVQMFNRAWRKVPIYHLLARLSLVGTVNSQRLSQRLLLLSLSQRRSL